MAQQRLLIVYGGRSSEHEISIRSAGEVLAHVDRDRWEPLLLGVRRDGRWRTAPADTPLAQALEIGREIHELGSLNPTVVFSLLHGPYGEDGAFQGLLETLDLPYVGSGVTASAICMDKALQKYVIGAAGSEIPLVPWFEVRASELQSVEARERIRQRVADDLGWPCFVKPSNMGSSVGVSAVRNPTDLEPALRTAASFDNKVVIEQGLDAREVEVAVLGNGASETMVSEPGEIVLPEGEWYDYDTKYEKDTARTVIPADLPKATAAQIRDVALHAYRVMGCSGMARIDFLVERRSLVPYLNELNTLPGFTTISMYPKMMEHAGVSYDRLITRLCELALERHGSRARLRTDR